MPPDDMPPVRFPETSALMLDNTFGDAEQATNVALATDLARLFAGLGVDVKTRVALVIDRLMPDIALAVSRNDPDCGIVVEVVRDDSELKLTISSDMTTLDKATVGRDERFVYVAMPFHLREYFSRQPRYAREG